MLKWSMPTLAENRKARFDYEFLEKYEAGLELKGFEVKAIRKGLMSLDGSYVAIIGNQGFLINAKIAPYQPLNTPKDYEIDRSRRILMKRKEINYLLGKSKERGLTLIPTNVYTKGNRIKLGIGVGRGRKKFDKREVLKKKATEREIQRFLKKEY